MARRQLRGLALVATLWAGPAAAFTGETGPSLTQPPIGSQVRVRSSALAKRVEGLVIGMDAHSLNVASKESGPLVKIPIQSIERLEVRTGSKRNALKGLVIGAALGALMGLAESQPNCNLSGGTSTRGGCTAYYSLGMGLLGFGVGALVKTDMWTAMPLSSGASAGLRKGLAFRVAVSF